MMCRIFTIALLTFGTACLASQDAPTRDELLQTVKHIQSLAHDQQSQLDSAKAQLTDARKQLAAANEQSSSLAKHDGEMTTCCNDCSKKLWWYRLHWWGAWIALGTGVIACGIVAFLKFTGRLSLSAASIASKI